MPIKNPNSFLYRERSKNIKMLKKVKKKNIRIKQDGVMKV